MTTKDILLKERQAASKNVKRSTCPHTNAKLDFESLSKVRAALNAKTLDNRASLAEMELLQALNALPGTMPKTFRTKGTSAAAHNFVWNDFAVRLNAALPAIEKLCVKAGVRR